MTLIELIRFLFIMGIGAVVGSGIAGVFGGNVGAGGIIGGVTSVLIIFAFVAWFGKMDSRHPSCRCGTSDWNDFNLSRSEYFSNVWQCSCGKIYSWPNWQLWFEITESNTARLFMKRDFFGRWAIATDSDVAHHQLHPIKRR